MGCYGRGCGSDERVECSLPALSVSSPANHCWCCGGIGAGIVYVRSSMSILE